MGFDIWDERFEICKYASMQVYKEAHMHIYASMQVWSYMQIHKYASMQVCKYTSMRVWEYASKQVCKYTQDKFMKTLGEVSSHCEIFSLSRHHSIYWTNFHLVEIGWK